MLIAQLPPLSQAAMASQSVPPAGRGEHHARGEGLDGEDGSKGGSNSGHGLQTLSHREVNDGPARLTLPQPQRRHRLDWRLRTGWCSSGHHDLVVVVHLVVLVGGADRCLASWRGYIPGSVSRLRPTTESTSGAERGSGEGPMCGGSVELAAASAVTPLARIGPPPCGGCR